MEIVTFDQQTNTFIPEEKGAGTLTRSLLLRAESEGVLLLSGDPESLCDVLRGDSVRTRNTWRSTGQPRWNDACLTELFSNK